MTNTNQPKPSETVSGLDLAAILAVGRAAVPDLKAKVDSIPELETKKTKLNGKQEIEAGMTLNMGAPKPEKFENINGAMETFSALKGNAMQFNEYLDTYISTYGYELPAKLTLSKQELDNLYNALDDQLKPLDATGKEAFMMAILSNEQTSKMVMKVINDYVSAVQNFITENESKTSLDLADVSTELNSAKELTPTRETPESLELARAAEYFRQDNTPRIYINSSSDNDKSKLVNQFLDFASEVIFEKLQDDLDTLGLDVKTRTDLFSILAGKNTYGNRVISIDEESTHAGNTDIQLRKNLEATISKRVKVEPDKLKPLIDMFTRYFSASIMLYSGVGNYPTWSREPRAKGVSDPRLYETPEITALIQICRKLNADRNSPIVNIEPIRLGLDGDSFVDETTGAYYKNGERGAYKAVYEQLTREFTARQQAKPDEQNLTVPLSVLQAMGTLAQIRKELTKLQKESAELRAAAIAAEAEKKAAGEKVGEITLDFNGRLEQVTREGEEKLARQKAADNAAREQMLQEEQHRYTQLDATYGTVLESTNWFKDEFNKRNAVIEEIEQAVQAAKPTKSLLGGEKPAVIPVVLLQEILKKAR